MARVLPSMMTHGSVLTPVRPAPTVRPGITLGTRTAVRPGTGLIWRLQAIGTGGQLVLLTLIWAAVGLGPAGWLAGTATAAATCLLFGLALRRKGRAGMGPADRVTLARAVLTGGVTALIADGLLGSERLTATATLWSSGVLALVVALGTVALVLDGVDGQIARRTGTASETGARFDMEVDAFLILVLSVHVATRLGAWVLLIGGMRYVFAAAGRHAPWLTSALPPSYARKTVAALQGIILVAAGSGALPPVAAAVAAVAALAMLLWSFGRDTCWLWRNRDLA